MKVGPRTTLLAAGAAYFYFRMEREQQQVERLAAAALETLLNAIDANDATTGAHVRRVARYALILADAYSVTPHERAGIERVALFHDIGKIQEALFDIVHDSDSLSPAERTLIATHPQRGADVLAPLSFFYPDLGEGVVAHHERWDGSGYPRALAGLEIPLSSRVVAIADTFDAITHQRRYTQPRTMNAAVAEIVSERGRQFDPELVDVFQSTRVLSAIRRAFRDGDPAQPAGRRLSSVGQGGRDAPDVAFRWRAGK